MSTLAVDKLGATSHQVVLFQGIILGSLYVLLHAPLVPGLVQEWYEHENFSYGFLIPPIFLYLLWEKRRVLSRISVEASLWGVFSLSGALLIGFIGKTFGDLFTARVAMVLAFAGLVHLFLGARLLKAVGFPLAYLLFMVPPPYVIVKEISYYLRTFDAVVATEILQAIGIPVYRDAYFLHLPNITLEVADICSGIASLFAMFALGAIYAYFLPLKFRYKLVLMLGIVLFPIIANLFRIVIVSAQVYGFGPVMLGSLIHQFTGTFTFLFSLVMVLALGEYLRKNFAEPEVGMRSSRASDSADYPAGQIGVSAQGRFFSPAFLLAAAIFVFGFYSSTLGGAGKIEINSDLKSLPSQLGPFLVSEVNWQDRYQDENAESLVSRIYRTPGGRLVELYLGYRGSQTSVRLSSPKLRPTERWDFAWSAEEQLTIPGMEPIRVNWMLSRKANASRLVLYWYRARGASFAGEFNYRLDQLKSFLSTGRTDGAVIRIAAPVFENEDMSQAKETIQQFVVYLHPWLVKMLPE